MRYLLIIFLLFLSFFFQNRALADEMVTVKLVNYIGDTKEVKLALKGEFYTLDPALSLKEGVNYQLKVNDGSIKIEGEEETFHINESFALIPKTYDENHVIYINDRPYLGSIEFQMEDGKNIRPVNQLFLEDYLKGVVPFEVYPSWELETLKAQTLAARTYAVTHMKKNMDDTIRFQVYGGFTWTENTTKAVDETKGEVITYKDRPIDAFYSASNGGITESNKHVWGGNALSYFPIKKDPYDPTHPWEFTLNRSQIVLDEINWDDQNWWDEIEEIDTEITAAMKSWLYNKGYSSDIKILSVSDFEITPKQLPSERTEEGALTVEFLQRLLDGTVLYEVIDFENGKVNRIRPLIGGNVFKSYLVDTFVDNDESYIVKGRGFGHGVGMSQWGAQMMAEQGKSYEEILQFYYPGTKIKNVTESH